jgi:two-component system, NtrC family, response regulator PilR
METAIQALKAGAFDFITKPIELGGLRAVVGQALRVSERRPEAETRLIGDSEAMRAIRVTITKLARSQAPVYISGESGSGKELAARLIHGNGARRDKPFVPVNCGAIPETLVESELFGYRKGAFTGATEDRDGFFQAAHGGTLFLDEVADLPLHTQVLLLRAIQERRARKVGSTQEEPVDARIICATNQSLAGMVEAGRFRRDLYYRLNVVDLTMPPLRECREDIPLIASHILQRLALQNGVPAPRLSAPALEELMAYDFPGNVRELENILERALALSSAEELGPDDLALHRISPEEEEESAPSEAQPAKPLDAPLPVYLDRLEREAILQALDKTGFNRTAAARILGITFRQLRYRMQRLSIKDENR